MPRGITFVKMKNSQRKSKTEISGIRIEIEMTIYVK